MKPKTIAYFIAVLSVGCMLSLLYYFVFNPKFQDRVLHTPGFTAVVIVWLVVLAVTFALSVTLIKQYERDSK